MVSAGEVSGDMHAAEVVKKISDIVPDSEFFGMGSTRLREAGAEIIIDPTEVSTIGYMEAVKNLKTHLKNLKTMKNLIKERKPDVVFLVDYSFFNMRMAKACSKFGVPAVDYFPPTAWIYRKKRADKMAAYGTEIAAVFPMERDVYEKAGAEVTFVGHPLIDMVKVDESRKEIRAELSCAEDEFLIGILPGSRKSEIDRLLCKMIKSAEKLKKTYDRVNFVIAAADRAAEEMIEKYQMEAGSNIKTVKDYSYQIMKGADFIITASGTATVEAAVLNTPMIICYQTGKTSYWLGKKVFKIDHIGMPNIIAGYELLPEFVQEDFTVNNIYSKAAEFIESPDKLDKICDGLKKVRKKLGGGGAVERTAELVVKKGGLK
ncbi:lipid-A-disaccharide synthase [Halanaerobium sp. MA284_MarDTE_T2]|uniref:lipid-A-disaccharide synthase n=2 Tax=unclassified Halanaerobium TaxID=2641197 RepID=UPI000E18477B|nr:lipid-A-disaccharide synthase [Halanaerobium sp. DL-01]RCW48238.1 lipid-A-disaccharide synthase [Halanaerobium sp. MA284_MarDTE_T2]RCW85665.1 lipid-A-disaccharide synthase [Halanaerobium sp. DL-01]